MRARMSLLALEGVTKRYSVGRRVTGALEGVSFSMLPGELVSVWGVPRSGKTTLLRVAAGLEPPDDGVVRFDGERVPVGREVLDERIAFARPDLRAARGQSIEDYVAMPLLVRGVPPKDAAARALAELARVGAAECAALTANDLDSTEAVRVALAQALVTSPRLLIVDEPTRDIDPRDRASILLLLRSIACRDVAVLMTTGEAIGVAGADRALAIQNGRVQTEATANVAPVIPLRRGHVEVG